MRISSKKFAALLLWLAVSALARAEIQTDTTSGDLTESQKAGLAPANFQTDTTPVDMRLYFPNAAVDFKYRRPDGSLYMRRVTRPNNDPMYSYLPDKSGTHFSRESYLPTSYYSESAPYHDSWSLRHGPDMSVTEVADSFAPDGSNFQSWNNGPGQYYAGGSGPAGIVHGKPGGHYLGEDYYYRWYDSVYHTNSVQTIVPTLLSGVSIWSGTRLNAKYNSYFPGYGRQSGVWGPGKGRTYTNVIAMVFVHGATSPASRPSGYHQESPTCSSNRPSWANHVGGFTSYWELIYYAPGYGEIEEKVLFDERYCAGTDSVGNASEGYHSYIDDNH